MYKQEKQTADPPIVEQLNAISKKHREAVNNNDAAVMAPLFTEGAIFVTDARPVSGQQANAQVGLG
jgi:ketosteroid isomerase-like protein